MFFEDRVHAGWVLGAALAGRVDGAEAVVLGISYGGLVVASGVASTLGAHIDAFVAPHPQSTIPFRLARNVPLRGRTVIVVDDGATTGETMRRAVAALHAWAPSRLIVALPVAPASVSAHLEPLVDEVVCLYSTAEPMAPAACYRDASAVGARAAVRCLTPPSASERAHLMEAYGIHPPAPVTASIRAVSKHLERGLRELEAALETGDLEGARLRLNAWRRELAGHLRWEESAVLPAYLRLCGRAVAAPDRDHAALHQTVLDIAADLSEDLARSHLRETPHLHLMAALLRRKFTEHREREVDGLATILDAAGARIELPGPGRDKVV